MATASCSGYLSRILSGLFPEPNGPPAAAIRPAVELVAHGVSNVGVACYLWLSAGVRVITLFTERRSTGVAGRTQHGYSYVHIKDVGNTPSLSFPYLWVINVPRLF